MMMIVLRKSTVRPSESVRRPSSRIWSNNWMTSGCAFSTSSKTRTAQSTRDRNRGGFLADDRLLQFRLQREQLLALLLFHPGKRDAGPVGHDLHHEVVVDHDPFFVAELLPALSHLILLRAKLLL